MKSQPNVVVVANQKGGVGKTTTTLNLGASLAAAEQRVLVIDLDPQGNLSSGLGHTRDEVVGHMYHVLTGEAELADVLVPTELEQLTLAPGHPDMTGAEVELVDAEDREARLSKALAPHLEHYDLILIDCPPSLGIVTLNALVAADSVIVPLQCEYFALEGLGQLLTTIERVKHAYNPELEVEGLLLCMFDKRTNLTHQVAAEVRAHFADEVFETTIPRNVRLSEAPSFGRPALLYDIDSAGAMAYLALAEEFVNRRAKRTATAKRRARREGAKGRATGANR